MARAARKHVKKPARDKTSRDIGAEIIAGLQEAIAFEAGADVDAIFKAAPISARHATVAPAPEFSAAEIAALRKEMGLSQTLFAQILNVSPETEKAWEQGKFLPGGSVRRLLQIASRRPAVLLEGIIEVSAVRRQTGPRRSRSTTRR